MRKRSKYRPRRMLLDPLGYVIEGTRPLTSHDSYLVDLKLRNHGAMMAVLQGSATKREINDLIAMHNIQEAIHRMIIQRIITDLYIEFDSSTLVRGKAALLELSARGAQTGRFICRAPEIQALNDLMDMHDELMGMITVMHMEKAITFANGEIRNKRATAINNYIPQGVLI